MVPATSIATPRQVQLVEAYKEFIKAHMAELRRGKAERILEISEIAARLHVHPVHLSNTVKAVTGRSTCDWYEHSLLDLSKELLLDYNRTIAQVAAQLTYDPSNFTKFFKRFSGQTPKQFRAAALQN